MTKKPSKKPRPISAKQRVEDDKLREELRHFDLKKFDKLLTRVVRSSG